MSVWVIFDCATNMPIDIVCDSDIIKYMDVFYDVKVFSTRFIGEIEPNIELVFRDKVYSGEFEAPFKYYAIPVTTKHVLYEL